MFVLVNPYFKALTHPARPSSLGWISYIKERVAISHDRSRIQIVSSLFFSGFPTLTMVIAVLVAANII
jgi:hypothetical protein